MFSWSMGDATGKTSFERLISVLVRHGVEFIVIGGRAELLYGGARVTFDTDLCYRRTPENLPRLASALRELNPALRGAPPGLAFRIDAEALALGCNYTFRTADGDLDLLGYVEPLGGYDELAPRVESVPFGPVTLQVIGLEDLIRVREYLARPKDRESLRQLQAIRKIRGAK